MNTVLVTGGSGFLGINLIRHLRAKGVQRIRVLDIADFDYPEKGEPWLEFTLGDVRDAAVVDRLTEGCDVVVNTAAALPLYSPEDIRTTEVDGIRNVLDSAKRFGVGRVVQISSTAVYGVPKKHPIYETDELIGVGPYGHAKIEAEELCRKARADGQTVCVIRPKSFIGPERLGVFALFYDWAYTGHGFPMIGSGDNRYQLMDVADLCDAIWNAMTYPCDKVNTEFNIGAKEFTTMKEDYQAVLDRAGYGKKIRGLPVKPIVFILRILEKLHLSPLYPWVYETASTDSFVSIERAERLLDFRPRFSNKDALVRNYEWYVEHLSEFAGKTGVSHRVPWKQGLLACAKWFFVLPLLAFAGVAGCLAPSANDCLSDLPACADPALVSRRVSEQFLRTRPESYCPPGYRGNGYNDKGYGGGRHVQYSVVSIWVNSLECARLRGDKTMEEKLIRLYDDFLPGGDRNKCCSRPYHVDDTIFGSIPYQIYLFNGDRRCLAEGNRYADTQWTPPCEGTLKERHAAPLEVQQKFWQQGYTPQTRLWIDDMYMIIAIQSQAYRATGDRKYIERTAKEMCLYLDELQLKEGPAKGLFYHAPDVKYVWGRGDGWMAGGMTLVLKHLPEDSPYRARILAGYRMMMETLLRYQRPDGKWSQLVDRPDDPRNWAESSCTAMFAYAFITGVRRGWLCPGKYGPAARKAWIALCESLDEYANVPATCCGTGKRDNLQYYFDRTRVHGDPHGQAPMLWCAGALMENL